MAPRPAPGPDTPADRLAARTRPRRRFSEPLLDEQLPHQMGFVAAVMAATSLIVAGIVWWSLR